MPLDFQNWLFKRKKLQQQQQELSPPRAQVCQEHEPLHCRVHTNPHFYTFILSAACWHRTPNQGATLKWEASPVYHLRAPALLALCPNRAVWIWETGGSGAVVRTVAQEKPEDQDPSLEPSSSQVSHFCAQLSPPARANGYSPLLQAPACQLQLHSAFFVKLRHAKQKLNFSTMCSP